MYRVSRQSATTLVELQGAIQNRDLARIELERSVEARSSIWSKGSAFSIAEFALRRLSGPFDGTVVERFLNPGDLAGSGSGRKVVLLLARSDPLHNDVALPDHLFGKVGAGDKSS